MDDQEKKEIKNKLDYNNWSNKYTELLIKSDKLLVLYFYIANTRLKVSPTIVLRASDRQISTLIKVVETIKIFNPSLFQKNTILSTNQNNQCKSFRTIMKVELTKSTKKGFSLVADTYHKTYTKDQALAIRECFHREAIEGELNYTREDIVTLANLKSQSNLIDWINEKDPSHLNNNAPFNLEPYQTDLNEERDRYRIRPRLNNYLHINQNKFVFFYKPPLRKAKRTHFLNRRCCIFGLGSKRNRCSFNPERGTSKKKRLGKFKIVHYPFTKKDKYMKESETISNKLSYKSKNLYNLSKRSYLYFDNKGLEKHKKVGCRYQYYDTDERAIVKSYPIISPYFTDYADDYKLKKIATYENPYTSVYSKGMGRFRNRGKVVIIKPRYFNNGSFNKVTFKNRIGVHKYYKGGFFKRNNTSIGKYGSLQVKVPRNLMEKLVERTRVAKKNFEARRELYSHQEYERVLDFNTLEEIEDLEEELIENSSHLKVKSNNRGSRGSFSIVNRKLYKLMNHLSHKKDIDEMKLLRSSKDCHDTDRQIQKIAKKRRMSGNKRP